MASTSAWLLEPPAGYRLLITDSHDVHGGNDDGFTSKYSYLYQDDEGSVLYDHRGNGCIRLVRTIGYTGELLVYRDDNPQLTIRTTFPQLYDSDAAVLGRVVGCDEDEGHGSAWAFVDWPFERSCRIVCREPMNAHHFYTIWSHVTAPGLVTGRNTVLASAAATGADGDERVSVVDVEEQALAPGRSLQVLDSSSTGVIEEIEIRFPSGIKRDELRALFLVARWDGADEPHIFAPLGLFFGCGYSPPGISRGIDEYPVDNGTRVRTGSCEVRAAMFETDEKRLRCSWPMPYGGGARVSIQNRGREPAGALRASVRVRSADGVADERFVALYRGEQGLLPGRDYTVVSVRGSGLYLGTAMRFRSRNLDHSSLVVQRQYLEGDARLYADGAGAFQSGSTGTEEYFNWGWYDVHPKDAVFSFPTHGYPEHVRELEDECTMYRLHVHDTVPFYHSFAFELEHGPEGRTSADYESVAWLYLSERRRLIISDMVAACPDDAGSRLAITGAAHRRSRSLVYEGSQQTSAREEDARGGEGPAFPFGTSDLIQTVGGESSFQVAIPPDHQLVRLRRRFSGEEGAAQACDVWIDGSSAGQWYLPAHHSRETWMEDEFDLPPELTRGKSRLAITLSNRAETEWGACRYWALVLIR